jgi:putative tryptophan/tyrosine transport system substrate-binding protein
MRRREVALLLGSVALGWPLASRAQQGAPPVIGVLNAQRPSDRPGLLDAFRQGLVETGYREGSNVLIEYRWAEGQVDRLPALAADLVQRRVAVILASGGNDAALVAKAATSTIPIVFTSGEDPVKYGLVTSSSRPEGNVTGVSWPGVELIAKRFQLVHELLPSIQTAALLINPRNVEARSQPIDPQERARSFGLQVFTVAASDEAGIDAAFAELEQRRPGALVIGTDPFFTNQARRIVAHATRLSLPTVYDNRDYVVAGGLVSYGNSIPNAYRRAGVYVGRILHGAKPGSLPIDLASEFEVVINLKTAATLGIQVPASVLVLANEVLD